MAEHTPENPPAFPRTCEHFDHRQDGMSLRDYFAAHAPMVPPSWPENQPVNNGDFDDWQHRLAIWEGEAQVKWAWHYADAMLEARAKGGAS